MQYATFTTTDKCPIAFQTSLPLPGSPSAGSAPTTSDSKKPDYATCILLLHGFSGSSAYFTRNCAALSAWHWVVAPDMRGHGRSGHNPSRGGYHVARLAADLRELLTHLARTTGRRTRFVPVGCSIGAAVVWTYLELFGEAAADFEFAGYVFMDQAPLQDRAPAFGGWDERFAHRGCFDEASMLAAQRAWAAPAGSEERQATHRALVRECLGYRFLPAAEGGDGVGEEEAAKDEDFFAGISALCDGEWLARLLADHTRYDHREACESITRPVMVMAGRRSGCFPLAGMEETARRVKKGGNKSAEWRVFESGHWLFYEEHEAFNREVLQFADRCTI